MTRRSYTPEEKAEALAMYPELGAAETARRLDIPTPTVISWAQRSGVRSNAAAKMAETVETARQRLEQRKMDLADQLLTDALAMRATLWEPTTERVVKVIGTGKGQSETTIVDVDLERPTYADRQRIMTAVAIAVDKVQILTGAPTERTEHVNVDREEAEERLAQLVHLHAV